MIPPPPELPDIDETPTLAPAPLRTCHVDGTHHFTDVKKLALSGKHYLHAVNHGIKPTALMREGTGVHHLVLGPRHGAKPIVVVDLAARRGKAWDAAAAEHADAEIFLEREWERCKAIAAALLAHPLAQARLTGARLEVPLEWEEGGLRCSTSGVDILRTTALGDLKVTQSTHPDTWMRHAWKNLYPMQLAWYRRGARANGLDVSGGCFLLGVEREAPFDVVDLELTEAMLDHADRTVSLWLEKLRLYTQTGEWPGYAQAPMPWDLPAFLRHDEDEDDLDEEGDATFDDDAEAA